MAQTSSKGGHEPGLEYGSEEMIAGLYGELRVLARAKLCSVPPGQTLQATALVHEAYLRLCGSDAWKNQAHFFASAAEAMRRILVDQARRKNAQRRGEGMKPEPLDEMAAPMPQRDERILQVHEALDELEKENARAAQVVKLRFFAGMKHEEIAQVLELSEKTVRRHWSLAKVWLYEHIAADNSGQR